MRSIPTTRGAAVCTLAAATLLLAPALAACTGSSSGDAQPGPAASSSAGGASSASYSTSTDVVSALKTAGHPCTPVSGNQATSVTAPGLRTVTACTVSTTDTSGTVSTITATVFDDHTDALAYAKLLTSAASSGLLIGSRSTRAVLGSNWVVLVPDDAVYAAQISAALGGAVLGGASSSAAG